MNAARILIIDDDEMICEAIASVLAEMDHVVDYALDLDGGLHKAAQMPHDVVFLDVRLPDGNGLDALPAFRDSPGAPEIIIITGEGDPDGAELAIKSGAWDYIEKPLSIKQMRLPLVRALQYREEIAANHTHKALKRNGIVGNSPQIKRCLSMVLQAAQSSASVLIVGETGTGKELIARAIHENSSRKSSNFVIVDCAALPESLVESTLFGHVKGAFTGAERDQEGLVKQADGGTLFLDEIGEMPLSLQRAFLRVIQEHRFRPIGSQLEQNSDFKLIAATHRNLDQLVPAGQFRQDLLFRLRSLTIELPPLRERTEDIMDLVIHYLTKLCNRYGIRQKGFSPEYINALVSYDWPGNVRELVNALERSISAAIDNPTLFPMHLPPHIRISLARSEIGTVHGPDDKSPPSEPPPAHFPLLKELLSQTEKDYLRDLMDYTGGNIREIGRISGLSRSRLYDRLKKYNISKPL